MNTKELQIGDWVNYRGTNIQVSSLYDKGGSNEIGWGDKESTWVNGRCIEPIPLTPEILKKNGWYEAKLDGSYGRKGVRLDGVKELPEGVDNALSFAQWSIDPKFEYHLLDVYMWKGHVSLWIEYVHQLQHIFRLCGIDKEIVL